MVYLERIPVAPLDRFVQLLWYARADDAATGRQRVLPSGCVQVIVSLARDFLIDCEEGACDRRVAPALVTGARTTYEIVDCSDMADLIGVIFTPGGFAGFAGDAVNLFRNKNVPLEDVWGGAARALRDQLLELGTPVARLHCLERFLASRMGTQDSGNALVEFAVRRFRQAPNIATVRDVARSTGWSERRFSQIFGERVGLSPKSWCRVQRFQRALRQLHAGVEVRWAELALDCGYYDQSHFANEFRAFSGVDATTYSARRTQWVNHIAVD
jgi:AraC-like DNA-binding protein